MGVPFAPTRGVRESLTTQLLLTAAVISGAVVVRFLVAGLVKLAAGCGWQRSEGARPRFWINQVTSLALLVAVVAGLLTIWVADVSRFASMAGLITAGIAVALQRVIMSFAAYLIVLRGRVYTVGDRITMGGVRGDVVRVGFMQTSVMEMGAPPAAKDASVDTWISARQYTGRLVSVTNDKLFDTPVYNYTREFPYMWDEMPIPIKYGADWQRAESILLDVARRHTREFVEKAKPALERLREKFVIALDIDLEPKVYVRLTDNWVEMTLRFTGPVHGIREIKDAMGRELLPAFAEAGLEVASGTYEIVGIPPLRIERADPPAQSL